MAKKQTVAFMGGIFLGSAIGAVVGLLVAPRAGKETRQILKKSASALPELAEDLSTTVQLQADRFSESALQNWDDTLVRLKEAIAAGIDATQLIEEDFEPIEPKNQETSTMAKSHLS